MRKVLVVDDQYGIRVLLKEILEKDGYAMYQAANGMQALTLIEQHQFDLVLLDVKLPGMNGLEILKQVKEQYPQVEVIMMTAYGELNLIKEARKLGALAYFTKPFDISEVRKIIANSFNDRK
ncbi:MAG TPA: response regulator [Bacilli bacterium]|nr:response regulator [Bacilli bacterium]